MDAIRFPPPLTPYTSRDACRPLSNLPRRLPAISSTLATPRNPKASLKPILARPSFADEGHAVYYQLHPTRGSTCLPEKQKKKKKKNDGVVEAKHLKKKLRRLEGLLQETIAFGDELNPFTNDPLLAETAKNMLERLQLVMAQEETAKAKRKGERSVACESSSSSSSESSDSEGEGMNVLLMSPGTSVANDNKSCRGLATVGMEDDESGDVGSKEVKVEVCMGSKCQRSGAGLVKEELERQVEMGRVVGCKCMGRCKEGPNVRISTPDSHISSVVTCSGVSLDDISSLLSSFPCPQALPI